MTTLLISDLHLEAQRPAIGEQFLQFLSNDANNADALYILGDLFEVWLGDDDPNPYYAAMKTALRRFTDTGVPVFFMHGNRDFTIGEQFAAETGVSILADPVFVNLHGHEVLLSHGDALCTDDVQYQQFRLMTRNPDWQAMMLTKSLQERIAYATAVRQESVARGGEISDEIMDVNQEAVHALFREYDADTLLHGHTHRPAVHDVDLGDRIATRIVLGDWYEQGSVVRWDENGPRLESLPR
jgi:UDP-2,3-diacylglucosamine hydrolase